MTRTRISGPVAKTIDVTKKTLAFTAAHQGTPHANQPNREFVQGLERGFAVVHAFGADARSLSITEVAQRTGLPRAVSRRINGVPPPFSMAPKSSTSRGCKPNAS